MSLFVLLSSIAGTFAVSTATILEHLFGKGRNVHISAVFVCWFGALLFYQAGAADILGLSLVVASIPPELTQGGMAFGIIANDSIATFHWDTLPSTMELAEWFQHNLMVLTLLSGFAIAVVHLPVRTRPKAVVIEASSSAANATTNITSEQLLSGSGGSLKHAISGFLLLLTRQNKVAVLMAVVTLILGSTMSENTSYVAVFWLASLFFVFQKKKMLLNSSTFLLEHSIAAYKYPSTGIVKVVVLTGLLCLPLTPVILKSPVQSLQTVVAIACVACWMVLSFSVLRRAVLGMSIFALYWYAFGLNEPGPALDLLGLYSQSWAALSINLIVLFSLLILLTRFTQTQLKK